MPSVSLTDGAVTARFEPGAGMIGTSLTDDGVELLGQGKGLRHYVDTGDVFGLPILHPWANRLRDWVIPRRAAPCGSRRANAGSAPMRTVW